MPVIKYGPDLEMNTAFQAVIDIFDVHTSELTLAQFILTLLEDSSLKTHPCTLALTKDTNNIITALSRHPDSTASIFTWANNIVKKKYLESIKELTRNKDWHFNASHASAEDLDDFRIEDMACQMKKKSEIGA
jgi:DNA helicase IV